VRAAARIRAHLHRAGFRRADTVCDLTADVWLPLVPSPSDYRCASERKPAMQRAPPGPCNPGSSERISMLMRLMIRSAAGLGDGPDVIGTIIWQCTDSTGLLAVRPRGG